MVIFMMILAGFFLLVASLLPFHLYLASKNLTSCKTINLIINFRGVPIMDENNLSQSVAKEVRKSL
jgi:hypothetical protein